MGITDEILALTKRQEPSSDNWIKELINSQYQDKAAKQKRTPIGFDFKRNPFDPSSYYNALQLTKDVSRLATNVTRQEVANREEAERQKAYDESQKALGGINPSFTYDPVAGGVSRKYKLKGVTSNVAKAADFWGSKYGISNIGGWREHGSVPNSDHPKGRALDFMINNIKNGKSTGDAMANDIIKNYKSWNVKYVIWNRYIWNPQSGWRKYNGPSPHTDHVHVSFNK